MLYDLVSDVLKFLITIMVRLFLGFMLWNYTIAPTYDLPFMHISTLFHLQLFATVMLSSFSIEKVEYNKEEDCN